jgi:hypothetical protein
MGIPSFSYARSLPELDFGTPKVGSSREALPSHLRKSKNCVEAKWGADCEYHSTDNIDYVVYGKTITKKELHLPTKLALPFGIKADDGPTIVRAKLAKATGKHFYYSKNDGDLCLSASESLREYDKTLYTCFRNRHLAVIGVTIGDYGE